MEAPRIISNGVDPELAYAAIHEIEKIDGELESEKGSYMARCKAIKDRRKATLEEYRDRGLSKGFIKGVIEIRKLNAKVEDIHADLAEDGSDQADLFNDFLAAVERGEAAFKGTLSEAAE